LKSRFIISILILLVSVSLKGQTEYEAEEPLFPGIVSWHELNIDPAQVEIMRSLDQPKDQPLQFAIPVQVNLTPEKDGFTVRQGSETVWVMPVSSKGALSLNMILSPFNLPEGAYVYVYDYDHQVLRGAYTNDSGGETGTMPLLPVPGERMILECHFPGKVIPSGSIGVKQVAHDFAGFFGLTDTKDTYFGRSGDCEVDIKCSTNSTYLRASRSVVRLLVAGAELCTGVLVNNTGSDYKAYVLTAEHCISNSSQASNTIFVFNYQSPWCDGQDLTNLHSLSGSLLRATNPDIDFTLVELNQFPSLVFKPYLSGWDVTTVVPSNTFTLHHPEGDVMKISIDNNQPVSATYPVTGFVDNGFWRILRWDIGTTENGSSGGPLFDQNGRLRGTLTGGAATCASPVNDYFAKLSMMFSITAIPGTHLRPWLDPTSSGSTIANGRDPYGYNLSKSDTLQNIPAGDAGRTDGYVSPGFGYSTGHNSDSLVRYAEYFSFAGTGEIAWVHIRVAVSSYLSETDSIRVFVWNGGAQPGAVIASRMIKLREVKNDFDLEVDFGRTVAVSGSYYVGYVIYYKNNLSQPQPQFAVEHSAPYALPDQNTAWFHDGSSWKPFTQHPSFPASVSLGISVIMVENSILNGIDDPGTGQTRLNVFPNPFSNSISFSISDISVTSSSLTMYDHSGRIVYAALYRNIFPGILTLELPGLAPGIYHYSLVNDSLTYTGTLIKMDTR
jgi:lysyl endopeptidase